MKKSIIFLAIFYTFSIFALQRGEAILTGDTYCRVHWHCSTANTKASCKSSYKSYYAVGNYVGMAYKWGGFDSPTQYLDKISKGDGAGSYSSDGVLSCVTGVDCSGFVSRAWHQTSKYGTSTISGISHYVSATMKKADAFNHAGHHIIMLAYFNRDGIPEIMEAHGGSGRKAEFRKISWSYVSGYKHIRYNDIEDDQNVEGTIDNPKMIYSFPFEDKGNTRNMNSLKIDKYSIAPTKMETGPEVIYKVTLNTSGTLNLTVTDNQPEGIDNDIHLLSSLNIDNNNMATDAIARDDHNINQQVEAGTYFIVVDSYSSSGVDKPGEYSLTVNFTSNETTDEDNSFPDNSVDNSIPDETVDNSIPDNNTVDNSIPDETVDNSFPDNSVDNSIPDETIDNSFPDETVDSSTKTDKEIPDKDSISIKKDADIPIEDDGGCSLIVF